MTTHPTIHSTQLNHSNFFIHYHSNFKHIFFYLFGGQTKQVLQPHLEEEKRPSKPPHTPTPPPKKKKKEKEGMAYGSAQPDSSLSRQSPKEVDKISNFFVISIIKSDRF